MAQNKAIDRRTISSAFKPVINDLRLVLITKALGGDAQLHLVGGTVRDVLLGIEPKDLDLCTMLSPLQAIDRLSQAQLKVVPSGIKHQTVLAVPISGQPGIEITTFHGKGMRPEGGLKAGGTVEEDLHCRDFTINAIAYDLNNLKLVDPVGGLEDLERGIIRAPGDKYERFAEDPLRVMRMVRFFCAAEYTIEEETYNAARATTPQLKKVSPERIRDEFSRILLSPKVSAGLQLLLNIGALDIFLPELVACKGFEQNEFHHLDLFDHTAEVVAKADKDLITRLAALLHDIGKPPSLSIDQDGRRHFFCHESIGAQISQKILERLRYSRHDTDAVCLLVKTHMRPVSAGKGGIRRLLRDTGEHFERWRNLKEADSTSLLVSKDEMLAELVDFDSRVSEIKNEPSVAPLSSLAINGSDLISLGLKPGPCFGRILRALHEKVLDNPELNKEETLLEIVRKEAGITDQPDGRSVI